jgi:hypothetical protein
MKQSTESGAALLSSEKHLSTEPPKVAAALHKQVYGRGRPGHRHCSLRPYARSGVAAMFNDIVVTPLCVAYERRQGYTDLIEETGKWRDASGWIPGILGSILSVAGFAAFFSNLHAPIGNPFNALFMLELEAELTLLEKTLKTYQCSDIHVPRQRGQYRYFRRPRTITSDKNDGETAHRVHNSGKCYGI